VVICLERGADLHTAQLMSLPLTVSCFSKIQICFTFLVPAHPGSPGKMAVKRVCVCVCVCNRVRLSPGTDVCLVVIFGWVRVRTGSTDGQGAALAVHATTPCIHCSRLCLSLTR